MKTQKNTILLILLFFSASLLFGQSFEHRKFKYNWKDEVKVDLHQSEKFKDYNTVVLYEETTLDIEVKNIKRYQVIQFNTQEAIDSYNWFRVPILMDPRSAAIESTYRADTSGFPKLLYEKINFFDARIIRNGLFVKAVLSESSYKREERTGENLLPYYIHYFYVRNLQPGDQLEVIISHNWPLQTYKYYLNELLPKQEVYVTVHNSSLGQVDAYTNPLLARFISNETSKKNETYKIIYEDLEPIDHHISSPILDLPRIEFFENKKYEITTRFFEKELVDTFSWKEFLYRFVNRIDPIELRTWDYYDLQADKTSQFFNQMKILAGNNFSGVGLMNFIHQYAVDQFNYKNDFNYFIHIENGFTELGNYLEKNTIREASRHEFYFNMLDRVNKPYYKIFLQDKRLQVIDTSHVGVFYGDHLSYVMFDQDSLACLYYPKRSRSGYYLNELPFYLSGQFAHLIPQSISRKIYDNYPEQIPYPLLYIPISKYEDNVKKVKTNVQISLENKTSTISSVLSLSGQYSTLTRGYYQYGSIDTTISPTYYADIFKNIRTAQIKADTAIKTYPFTHDFSMQGSDYANVFLTIDGDYVIDLAGLINIHYERLDDHFFKAPYAHDFMGSEEFIVDLNFDQLVEMKDMDIYDQLIVTNGFEWNSNMIKLADNQYRLIINWKVYEETTEAKGLPYLEEAFKIIKQMSQLKLKIKPA